MKYGYKLLFNMVGLGFFHYAVWLKIDFFYFFETLLPLVVDQT